MELAERSYDWAKLRHQQVADEAEGIRNSFGIVVAGIAFVLASVVALAIALLENSLSIPAGWRGLGLILIAASCLFNLIAFFQVVLGLMRGMVSQGAVQGRTALTALPGSAALQEAEAEAPTILASRLPEVNAADVQAYVTYAAISHLERATDALAELSADLLLLRARAIGFAWGSALSLSLALFAVLLAKLLV